METRTLNMLGVYGDWASEYAEGKRKLSFLNDRWTSCEKWKQEAKAKLFDLLQMPKAGLTRPPQIIKKYSYNGLAIEEISWNLSYGPETHAVFLKPLNSKGPLPGILALHDHGGIKYFGKSKIIQKSKNLHPFIYTHQKDYYGGVAWANEIAKRGYGVLVHDVFPFESRKILASELPAHVVKKRMMIHPLEIREISPDDLVSDTTSTDFDVTNEESLVDIKSYNAFGEQHESIIAKSLFSAGLTWPGVFVSEDIHALDYLCSRDDIDKSHIGCCGLSGGGLRTNYLAGIDERIKCSVTAGFMTTWRDLIVNVSYTHTWMVYIPLLPLFLDFPEILGLRVPLPSLVLATTDDPLYTFKEVQKAGETLRNIYKKAKSTNTFQISIYEGPHKFDLPMQAEAWRWMDLWLK
jgi:dienelactone hydrolase